MKELHITLLTGQACALFGDSPFQCISVKSTMDEKSKAKFEKKISSLQTKLDKKTSLYTGLQERYRKSKTTLEAKRRKYYEQVKAVRNTYKGKVADAQLETKIRKNYGTLVQSYLKKSRPIVWQNTDMISLQSIMDSNIHALK